MGFKCKQVNCLCKCLFMSKTDEFKVVENVLTLKKNKKQLVNNLANVYFCYILSKFIKLHKHDLCAQHPALRVFYIADEKQKVCACVSAMQAVSPKIVADGLVLPLFLQRNATATSITSIKLCNKLNS